ncbi:MAG: hypothetical protein ACKV1O_30095 [Saprospiraceae bacterium]
MSQRLPLSQYSKTKVKVQSYIQADIDISNAAKERGVNKLPGFGEAIFSPGKAREGSLA